MFDFYEWVSVLKFFLRRLESFNIFFIYIYSKKRDISFAKRTTLIYIKQIYITELVTIWNKFLKWTLSISKVKIQISR